MVWGLGFRELEKDNIVWTLAGSTANTFHCKTDLLLTLGPFSEISANPEAGSET